MWCSRSKGLNDTKMLEKVKGKEEEEEFRFGCRL